MSTQKLVALEGNEAAAYVAHKTNEVIAIYPITPSSNMGELSDAYSAKGQKNLWGVVPSVTAMQHEGGAAAAVHGSLQTGSLTTTFTASQGLLLMIPSMYKIAGELTPGVIHVAARALAAQGLSIFGDHGDVMSVRSTGYCMLSSCSPQEAMDGALLAQAATLEARIPFLHFFDGFRTSHEVNMVEPILDEVMKSLLPDELIRQHRARAMSPDHPSIRGTSQNPDVYFQGRETVNPLYAKVPEIVQKAMDKFGEATGRRYKLFEYLGAEDAERVIVQMGSATQASEETVEHLVARGEKVGLLRVRLFRPFSSRHLIDALPASVRNIAVLDRCKEPGADGEPLYKDVVTALATHATSGGVKFPIMPRVVGGRYGLASKEFNPGMIKAIFDELDKENPKRNFTVGIRDDLANTSLEWDDGFTVIDAEKVNQCVFYGLGSDGTVSANKNSIKIIGEGTDLYAQGYFVYDSKKAGAMTTSHLRFGPDPIRSTYLIGDRQAHFVAVHQPVFLETHDVLEKSADGSVFLLNSPEGEDKVWQSLPRSMQQTLIDRNIEFYVIDAYKVARETGMGMRINTIMQTCFFAISGVLPRDEAIARIKEAVEKSYGKKGQEVVDQNFRAIDAAVHSLHKVEVPAKVTSNKEMRPPVTANAPEFVRNVIGEIIAGRGNQLPVSAIPQDGVWPAGSARYEKRNLAQEIPVWEEDLCIFCGKCVFVCPHSAIRSKVFMPEDVADAPAEFKHIEVKGKEFDKGMHISYQVAPEDCTGCTLCVDICPAKDKQDPERWSLNMRPQAPIRAQEVRNWDYFLTIPEFDRERINWGAMKTAMLAEPLFEASGACVGCGETPYVRLSTQLFGDRMYIANATGCSSIFGGNLPTTPYSPNAQGRGPTWNNSLFEDTAEFGMGFRLSVDKQEEYARVLLEKLRPEIDDDELLNAVLNADQGDEMGIFAQRVRIDELKEKVAKLDSEEARNLMAVIDKLAKKSIWVFGGDGWAYDIGYSGLDHILASGENMNVLILDTEVYSNTGGQMSKATPLGAVAKFAAGGKRFRKKDLGLIAMSYGDVYVAQVCYGAKDVRTLKAFSEAESYNGVSVIIAYAPCIEHGVPLAKSHQQQVMAVESGHFPLFRFDPRLEKQGKNPLQLDSKEPKVDYKLFMDSENRFRMLQRHDPEAAEQLLEEAQKEVHKRYERYQQMAAIELENA